MGNLVTIFSRLLLLALWDIGSAQRCLFGRCDALLLAISFNALALMHAICTIRWLFGSLNGQMWHRNSNLPLMNGQSRFCYGQLASIKAKCALR